jgi:Predicted transcriptional regulators
MQIETVLIETLVPDPRNVRVHSTKNLDAIKASLRMFGQQIPLVVGQGNVVLKGNGSLQCMKDLGWKEAAIHRTTLEGSQAIQFSIADNRSAELAEWDLEQLSMAIQTDEQFADHLLKFGWTSPEIEPLRLAEWNPDEPLEVMPGTTSVAPPPAMFLDFDEQQLSRLAAPLAQWRTIHPSIADSTDSEIICQIAEQWVHWEHRLRGQP